MMTAAVDDQPARDATKMPEGVFQATNERLGRLAPCDLGVALARVTQHAAKQMRTPAAALFDDPGTAAEVGLQLFARGAFHPPERQIEAHAQSPREALDRLVAAAESMIADQILVDPRERQPLLQPNLDLGAVRLTVAAATRRPEGRNGWFCLLRGRKPGGRNGWF